MEFKEEVCSRQDIVSPFFHAKVERISDENLRESDRSDAKADSVLNRGAQDIHAEILWWNYFTCALVSGKILSRCYFLQISLIFWPVIEGRAKRKLAIKAGSQQRANIKPEYIQREVNLCQIY